MKACGNFEWQIKTTTTCIIPHIHTHNFFHTTIPSPSSQIFQALMAQTHSSLSTIVLVDSHPTEVMQGMGRWRTGVSTGLYRIICFFSHIFFAALFPVHFGFFFDLIVCCSSFLSPRIQHPRLLMQAVFPGFVPHIHYLSPFTAIHKYIPYRTIPSRTKPHIHHSTPPLCSWFFALTPKEMKREPEDSYFWLTDLVIFPIGCILHALVKFSSKGGWAKHQSAAGAGEASTKMGELSRSSK